MLPRSNSIKEEAKNETKMLLLNNKNIKDVN